MAIVTGRLGLEDLLWGEGTVVQDLGNGRSRTVSKINAKNLPFDETKTLAKAIDDALAIFNTADIKYLTDNLPAVIQVSEVLAKIKAMNITDIASVADALPTLHLIVNNIQTINNAITASLAAKQAAADAKYLRCDIQDQLNIANMHAVRIESIYNEQLVPLQDTINNLLDVAKNLVANARSQVIEGHEIAVKFATYDLKLRVVPGCRTPSIRINDNAKEIVWSIPRPICATSVEVTPGQVSEAVDEYLQTLGIYTDATIAITQEEINDIVGNSINDNNTSTLAALGTVVARVSTLEELQAVAIDPIGANIQALDLGIVDGSNTQENGIYVYDGTTWVQIVVNSEQVANVTQEDVDNAIN